MKTIGNKKVLIYIHGFRSSGESSTSKYLESVLKDFIVLSFDIPVEPNKALTYIKDLCNIYNPDIVVGNSLGGFYTAQLSSKYNKILINPAIRPLEANLDLSTPREYSFFSNREDGIQNFEFKSEYVEQLKIMQTLIFSNSDFEDNVTTHAFFATNDEVISKNDVNIFRNSHYAKSLTTYDGKHQISKDNIDKYIVPKIYEMVDSGRLEMLG